MNLRVIIVCSLLALAVTSVQSAYSVDDLMAQGRSLYTTNCQICHGPNGKGNGPAAAALNPKPADYSVKNFWASHSDEQIAEIIQHGKGQMPPFHFSSDQVKAIIYFLKHAFKPAA